MGGNDAVFMYRKPFYSVCRPHESRKNGMFGVCVYARAGRLGMNFCG